jgi:hypothetical protein
VDALAAGGLRGLAGASPLPRLGRRPRADGVMRSFPLAALQDAPPASGYCDGAPAIEGPQARACCVGASPLRQCSVRPVQITGGHWRPQQWSAELDRRAPARRPPRHEH